MKDSWYRIKKGEMVEVLKVERNNTSMGSVKSLVQDNWLFEEVVVLNREESGNLLREAFTRGTEAAIKAIAQGVKELPDD